MRSADIRREFIRLYQNGEFVKDKTGAKLVEILGASFLVDEDIIFGSVKPDYVQMELEFYTSMSDNVNDMNGKVPMLWKQVANERGKCLSNYGRLIWHPNYHNQYKLCLNQLLDYPEGRRAIMVYTRPSLLVEYNKDGMNDMICGNVQNILIRNNRLIYVSQHRANDAVFGFNNDVLWHRHVADCLVMDLRQYGQIDLEGVDLYWQVASMHVYERHFKFIEEAAK